MARFDEDFAKGGRVPKAGMVLTNGFAPPSPEALRYRAEAGATGQWGTSNISHHNDSRSAKEALLGLATHVERENRGDVVATASDIAMRPDGMIYRDAGQPMAIEQAAFKQLMTLVPSAKGAAGYLADCPLPQRVPHVNHWLDTMRKGEQSALDAELARREREGVTSKDKMPERKAIQLRMRNGTGDWRVWAVAGEKYPHPDVNLVARLLADEVPDNASIMFRYDGYRVTIKAFWPTDSPDFSGLGFELRTGDAANASQKLYVFAYDKACTNGLIVKVGPEVKLRDSHRGTTQKMLGRLAENVGAVKTAFPRFLNAWSEAKHEKVLNTGSEQTPESLFTNLVESKRLAIPGWGTQSKRKEAIERLVRAHGTPKCSRAPANSKARVIDAITYAAHQYTWANSPGAKWRVENEMQQQAGELVYVRLN